MPLRAYDTPSDASGALTVPALGLVGGLLAATRPEAVVLFPLVIVALCVLGARPSSRALMRGALAYGTVTGAVFLWRQTHYGDWLPNSVIAKSVSFDDPRLSNVIEQRVRDGITYVLEAYATYPAFATVSTVAILLGVARALSRRSVVLLVPLVLAHVIAVENGGDWMPQFRLLSMYWPLWIIVGWSAVTDLSRRHQRLAFAVIVVGLLLHGWSAAQAILAVEEVPVEASFENSWPRVTVTDDASFNGFSFAYEEVGRALRHVWSAGDVLAAESIGRLGYVAPELFIHDPMGLTDRTLAHDRTAFQNVYGRMNWRYTMGLEPAVVLLHFWPHQRDWATYGISYPEQFERYCLQPPFDEDDPFTLYIIVRRDRPGYSTALRHIGVRPLDTANGHVGCPIRSRVK